MTRHRGSIHFKILFIFSLTLCVYLFGTMFVYQRMLDRATRDQAAQGARQSMEMLISGIDSEVESARYISNSLLLNSDILRWLRTPRETRTAEVTQSANKALIQTYAIYPYIESIFLYDNDSVCINATNHLTYSLVTRITETPWFERAVQLDGGSYLSINAEGTLLSTSGQNNISLIRRILDVDSMKPTGFLILNFNERFITSITNGASRKYDVQFYLYDENSESIIRNQRFSLADLNMADDSDIQWIDGERMFLYRVQFPQYAWTVVSAVPFSAQSMAPFAAQMFFLPLLAAVGMYVFVSLYIAQLITRPIRKLTDSMRSARGGKFEPVAPNGRKDEFGELEENYNIMINALNDMIKQRMVMEQDRRRYELLIITEQFKPHFLYNTLDSISYLIHSGENAQAYNAVITLSRYYNSSLMKGAAMVPLRSEIDMIQSYLSLQKLRYADMITDTYEITQEAGETLVLRNILQPLVENSIYHGIKPSGEPGRIPISARIAGDMLLISVRADGIGMTLEPVNE
ncbi:MAG: histidine kinase [Oscillospiraceae bacterium]|nr:histidine kinase [Oscillospiraceae bacterium]